MTEAFDRIKAAIADRYTIERELGSGGMATLYLAEDVKHQRKVAVIAVIFLKIRRQSPIFHTC
jgi:serine/threonine-protein kinase